MAVLKPLLITGSVLALLAAGGVVGDGLARSAAQDQVAAQLQSELGLAERPSVELGGVPFTAVLVTRKVPTATLEAVDVPLEVSGQELSLDRVSVDARDLVLGSGEVVVGQAQAEILLGYPALTTLAGFPVEADTDPGRLKVSYTADLFGRKLVAVVTAVPELAADGTRLELSDPRISIAGFDLGEDVAQRIMNQLVRPIDLDLPYGLVPDSIAVAEDGMTARLTASSVAVPLG